MRLLKYNKDQLNEYSVFGFVNSFLICLMDKISLLQSQIEELANNTSQLILLERKSKKTELDLKRSVRFMKEIARYQDEPELELDYDCVRLDESLMMQTVFSV